MIVNGEGYLDSITAEDSDSLPGEAVQGNSDGFQSQYRGSGW